MKLQRSLIALAVLTAYGCAHVDISKVVTVETRENGQTRLVEKTEGPKGMRFYLPRPYVSVYEPFVIDSDTYLITGTVTPDGKYVYANASSIPEKLRGQLQIQYPQGNVPTSAIKVLPATAQNAGPQTATQPPEATPPTDSGSSNGSDPAEKPPADGDTAENTPDGNNPATGNPPDGEQQGEDETKKASSGILNLKVANDNSAFAVTPQRRYFDIAWLPDWDEQYVVEARAGLGNAGVEITTGQGWSLQGLEANVDNSAIVKPLLDLYGQSLDLLGNLAKAKLGVPPVASGGGPQAAVADAKSAVFEGGTPVLLKVTAVRVVAPGLYKILKPSELKGLTTTDLVSYEGTFGNRLHLPVYPFTDIAFNTYEVLVIEAARPEGDVPSNLQRYFSEAGEAGAVPASGTSPEAISPATGNGGDCQSPTVLQKALNTSLGTQKGPNGAFWNVQNATKEDGKLVLKVTLTGTPPAPPSVADEAQLKALVEKRVGQCYQGVEVK